MSMLEEIAGFFRRNKKTAATRQLEEHKALRMAQDKARVLNIGRWPLVVILPVKKQPWIEPRPRIDLDFGDIWLGDVQRDEFIVRDKHDGSKVLARFASVDELVRVWSVD